MSDRDREALLAAYRTLRDEVDRRAAVIVMRLAPALACGPGCSGCCDELELFAIERAAVAQSLREAGVDLAALEHDPSRSCGFLDDKDRCRIYNHRPIICRTQGLPLSFLPADATDDERAVTFCPLCFAGQDPEHLEFDERNTMDLEAVNTRLALLARLWERLVGLPPGARRPLAGLVEELP